MRLRALVLMIVAGHTVALFAAPLLQANNQPKPVQAPADSRLSDKQLEAMVKVMSPPTTEYAELAPISEALARGEFKDAISLSTQNISARVDAYGTEFYGYHIRAASYYYRARAALQSGGQPEHVAADFLAAIRNGNRGAAEEFAKDFLQRGPIRQYTGELQPSELLETFRIGAELGDPFSAAALGLAGLDLPIDASERNYWALFAIVRDPVIELERKYAVLASLVASIGQEAAIKSFEEFSLLGGLLPASNLGLPGRSLQTALFVDSDLRGTYGILREHSPDPKTKPPVAPTIREQFNFYSSIVPQISRADVYLLVPRKGTSDNARILYLSAPQIIEMLQPDDRVFVRCGALSHVAQVFAVDRERDEIRFADANYQFWRTSHNSCVGRFKLFEESHRKYLAVVGRSDVTSMLQAVVTIRDKR